MLYVLPYVYVYKPVYAVHKQYQIYTKGIEGAQIMATPTQIKWEDIDIDLLTCCVVSLSFQTCFALSPWPE